MRDVGLMDDDAGLRFVPVASSSRVIVKAESEGFVSFSNSPYYSHEHGVAIDLYSRDKTTAYSPLDGVVIAKHVVMSPRPRHFQGSETEHLLIIQPSQTKELVARILHIESSLSAEDEVRVGKPLGKLVRSGFFDFWTENHIHVEVRSPAQPLRAKGSLPMTPIPQDEDVVGMPCDYSPLLNVADSNSFYVLARAVEGEVCMGFFRGFGCRVGKHVGILDAGLPHYGFGGAILGQTSEVKVGDEVVFWGMGVGKVVSVSEGFAVFRTYPLKIEVNGNRIRGLSLYPWLRSPLLKLIPQAPAQEPLLTKDDGEFRLALSRP
jgi:hypothetical protein